MMALGLGFLIIVADHIWVARRGDPPPQLFRPKALGRLIERTAAAWGNEPTRKFRQARLVHEEYIARCSIATDAVTEDQRRHAAVAPELKLAEQLYTEALNAIATQGNEVNRAVGHQQLGLLYWIRGNSGDSLNHYKSSYETLSKAPFNDDHSLSIQSVNHFFLSLIALEAGNFGEAERQLDLSGRINHLLGDVRASAQDAALRERIASLQARRD
jgi:hypothetical protein